MRASRYFAVVLATLALMTVACGQWTPPLPTAPSDPAKGATISGTVSGLNGSASATAWSTTSSTTESRGLTVTVVGTDITVAVSGSGKFVLTGVPGGNIQLRFSGQGVDATIAINGVTSEHIQIVVTLNGSTVTIDSMNRVQAENNAEVEGVISSISHGDRSMKVNGFEIKVREAPIWNGSSRVGIDTLAVGQRVRIKGSWVHDYVVASEVVVNPGSSPGPTPPPSGGANQVEGAISSISHGDRSMKVNGIEIKIWDAPIYQGGQRIGISLLSPGMRVRVNGNWVHDYLVATEVFVL
jgi:hypothetical protein